MREKMDRFFPKKKKRGKPSLGGRGKEKKT